MNKTKHQLKRLATQSVQKRGVQGITFRELGKAIDIKSSSAFYHFGSKDNLLYEIAQDYHHEFLSRLEAIKKEYEEPLDQLLELVKLFEQPYREQSFCLCGALAAEVNELSEETTVTLRDYFEGIENWVFGILKECVPQKEATMYARLMVAGLEGALLLDRVEGKLKYLGTMKNWIKFLLT